MHPLQSAALQSVSTNQSMLLQLMTTTAEIMCKYDRTSPVRSDLTCFVFVPAPVLRKEDYLKLVEERKRKEEEDKKRKEEEEKKKKEEAERKKKEEEEKKKKEEEEKKKADKPGEKKEEKKEEKKDGKADKEQKSICPKMKCTCVDFLLKPIEDRIDKRLDTSIDPFTGYIYKYAYI